MHDPRSEGVNFVEPLPSGPGWEAYFGMAVAAILVAIVLGVVYLLPV